MLLCARRRAPFLLLAASCLCAATEDADAALLEWVAREGGQVSGVAIRRDSTGRRGLYALTNETTLFSLPRRLVWSSLVASEDAELLSAISARACTAQVLDFGGVRLGSSMDVLSAHVAFEKSLDRSAWRHYLEAVGPADTPWYVVASGLLPGGDVGASRAVREAFSESTYLARRIDDAATEKLALAAVLAEALRIDQRVALWALGVVHSRAVWLGEELGSALIPLWDLVNHAGTGRTVDQTLIFDDVNAYYVGNSHDDDEVVHDYGLRSNCTMDWLLGFGFVPITLLLDVENPCTEVLVRGRRFALPEDRDELLAQEGALAAVESRALQLPTLEDLRGRLLGVDINRQNAALAMIHERRALESIVNHIKAT